MHIAMFFNAASSSGSCFLKLEYGYMNETGDREDFERIPVLTISDNHERRDCKREGVMRLNLTKVLQEHLFATDL